MYSSCRRSGVSLALTTRRLQKVARSSGYSVTESDERARLVIDRRQYHRVPSGMPHSAQTSTNWQSFIVQTLWRVSHFDDQTAPKGAPRTSERCSLGLSIFARDCEMSVYRDLHDRQQRPRAPKMAHIWYGHIPSTGNAIGAKLKACARK